MHRHPTECCWSQTITSYHVHFPCEPELASFLWFSRSTNSVKALIKQHWPQTVTRPHPFFIYHWQKAHFFSYTGSSTSEPTGWNFTLASEKVQDCDSADPTHEHIPIRNILNTRWIRKPHKSTKSNICCVTKTPQIMKLPSELMRESYEWLSS